MSSTPGHIRTIMVERYWWLKGRSNDEMTRIQIADQVIKYLILTPSNMPANLDDLRVRLSDEVYNLNLQPEILQRVTKSFQNRIVLCFRVHGQTFKHLLKSSKAVRILRDDWLQEDELRQVLEDLANNFDTEEESIESEHVEDSEAMNVDYFSDDE